MQKKIIPEKEYHWEEFCPLCEYFDAKFGYCSALRISIHKNQAQFTELCQREHFKEISSSYTDAPNIDNLTTKHEIIRLWPTHRLIGLIKDNNSKYSEDLIHSIDHELKKRSRKKPSGDSQQQHSKTNHDLRESDSDEVITEDNQDLILESCKLCNNRTFESLRWKLVPLVIKGQEVPEFEGSTIKEIYNAFWLDTEVLIFWAELDWKKKFTGLFSLKNNKMKMVMTDKCEIVADTKEPIHQNIKLPGQFEDDRMKEVKPSGQRMYINTKMKEGLFSSNYNTYAWDGDYFQSVLSAGDEITIKNQKHTIASAKLEKVSQHGSALIQFKTDSPEKKRGLCLYNGSNTIVLSCDGDKLPMKGNPGFYYSSGFYVGYDYTFVFNNSVIYRNSGDPQGLFKLFDGRINKIIATGDAYSPNPGKYKIEIIRSFYALKPDLILIGACISPHSLFLGPPFDAIMLYNRRKIESLLTIEGQEFSLQSAVLLPGLPNQFLFAYETSRREAGGIDTTIYKYRVDLYYYDGERLLKLTENIPFGLITELRVLMHGKPGVMIIGKKLLPDKKGKLQMELKDSQYFFDMNAPDKGLLPLPEFRITDDCTINFSDIIAWKSCNEAIVKLKDGIYLLAKEIVCMVFIKHFLMFS
jgi:hypothetical protein